MILKTLFFSTDIQNQEGHGGSIRTQVSDDSSHAYVYYNVFISGCACDVPSALYSFSFEQNPNWTKLMPPNEEIRAYALGVAEKYSLVSKMRFNCNVERCDWLEQGSRWLLHIRDKKTGELFLHECQILFSAAGQLVQPRELDIPGLDSFKGAVFHSARWDHSVSLDGKDVVVIGNGCLFKQVHSQPRILTLLGTAAQIVPAIIPKVKTLTQIIRTKHWIFQAANVNYTPFTKWCFRNVPGAMELHRLLIFAIAESDLPLFYMNKIGALARARKRRVVEKFMKEKAPRKYHKLLIPDFDVGCKVRTPQTGISLLVSTSTNLSSGVYLTTATLTACTPLTSI